MSSSTQVTPTATAAPTPTPTPTPTTDQSNSTSPLYNLNDGTRTHTRFQLSPSLLSPLSEANNHNHNHNKHDNHSDNDNENDLSSETFRVVLKKLEDEAAKKVKEGFNKWNFTFGVFNTHVIAFTWAVYPEHFWILYIIEAAFFLSFRLYKLWYKRPLNQALHYLDFCWVTSIACNIFLCIVLFVGGPHGTVFSDVFRQEFFNLAFGVGCGPLFGALLVTPLPLAFHSNETMASVFIHFFPPLQLYILRWNNSVMKEVWPTFWYGDFDFLNFWPRDGFWGSVFGNTLVFYFCWAVPYMIWQLTVGLDLPRTHRKKRHRLTGLPLQPRYDTVYHLNMRDGQCVWIGALFWGRSKEESKRMIETNEYEIRDFFVYMFLHFFGVFASVVLLAWFCSLSRHVHAAWIYGIFLLVILRGANRYVYYGTKMYTSIVRKQFKTLINDEDRALLISKSLSGDNNGGGGGDENDENETYSEALNDFMFKVRGMMGRKNKLSADSSFDQKERYAYQIKGQSKV